VKAVTVLIWLFALTLQACSDPRGAAFDAMLACRNEFVASFKTISDSARSLSEAQRLELLVKAVMHRQDCEQKIGK